jgi:HSP20 family protein
MGGDDTMATNPLSLFRPGVGGSDPFLALHREMNRLFDDVLRGGALTSPGSERTQFVATQMNVSETANELRITAEPPGMSQDDVEITLDDDIVTIRGEKTFEKKDDKENFHFVERSYGTFQRSLRLPFRPKPDDVRAIFENGVLTLTLPKAKSEEGTRRVRIQNPPETAGAGTSRASSGSGEA